jgi:hypothetical protein
MVHTKADVFINARWHLFSGVYEDIRYCMYHDNSSVIPKTLRHRLGRIIDQRIFRFVLSWKYLPRTRRKGSWLLCNCASHLNWTTLWILSCVFFYNIVVMCWQRRIFFIHDLLKRTAFDFPFPLPARPLFTPLPHAIYARVSFGVLHGYTSLHQLRAHHLPYLPSVGSPFVPVSSLTCEEMFSATSFYSPELAFFRASSFFYIEV